MGGNWNNQITEGDEFAYLRASLHGVTGPTLDLACGAGHWTTSVAQTIGIGNLIALDLSAPLLRLCRATNPRDPRPRRRRWPYRSALTH